MRSSQSRLGLGALLVVAALGGAACKELVKPIPPADPDAAPPLAGGTLLHPDGTPLVDTHLNVGRFDGSTDSWIGRTDDDGYFLSDLEPGVYDIIVSATQQHPRWVMLGVDLPGPDTEVSIDALLVSAVLNWPAEAPVSFPRVDLNHRFLGFEVDLQFREIDEEGRFEAWLPRAGNYWVEISFNFGTGVFAGPDSLWIDPSVPLVLDLPLVPLGLDLTRAGQPVTPGAVEIELDNGDRRLFWSSADPTQGQVGWGFAGLNAVQVSAFFLSTLPYEGFIDVQPGAVLQAELGRYLLDLLLVDSSGAPVSRRGFRIQPERGEEGIFTTDGVGREAVYLNPGVYRVTAPSPWPEMGPLDATVTVTGDTFLQLAFPPAP